MKRGGNFIFNKKALSDIVSTLLILLLVFVAVAILWVVVRNVIQQGTEQVSLGKFTLDLEIERVTIQASSVDVKLRRNVGAGDFSGLNFIIDDGENSEIVQVKNISMVEYAERTFILTPPTINPNNVKTVEVAPIFTLSSGKEVVGDVKDTYIMPTDTGGIPYVPPVENCNNGIINLGEDCDGTNISSGATCASVLGSSSATGTLSCTSACTYSTTGCSIPTCGDGDIDAGEDCDSDSLLNGGTCTTALGGAATGTLGCQENSCQYDTTGCTLSPVCGDGVVAGTEACDDGDVSSGDGCSSSCVVESGYTCTGTAPSVCALINNCGNGAINSPEECDGSNLNGGTCASVMGTGYTGTLSCNSSCNYVTTGCTSSCTGTSTGFLAPSAIGSGTNFVNPANAYSSNDQRAVINYDHFPANQIYYNFGANVPTGATIDGIEISVEAHNGESVAYAHLNIELSWNGGSSYTANGNDNTFNAYTDQTKTIGSSTSLFGRAWSADEFSNTNFRLRAIATDPTGGNPFSFNIDAISIRVHYTPSC